MKKVLTLALCCSLFPALHAEDKLADQFSLTGQIPSLEWVPGMLKGRYNLDQMGGLGQLMELGGPDVTMPLLAQTLNRSKLLYMPEVACVIATSSHRVETIRKMLSFKETKQLGASALAAMTVVEYLYAEKDRTCGKSPAKIPEGKNAPDKFPDTKLSKITGDDATKFSKEIGALLLEKNEALIEYGLIAAAYTADKAHAEIVKNLKAKTGGIPGLKILYAARCGLPVEKELVTTAFTKSACRGESVNRTTAALSMCQTLVPSVCSAAEGIGLLEADGAAFIEELHKALLNERDIRSQVAAAIAIGRVRSEDSVPVLLQAMEKCDWPVFVHILDALGRIPSAQSMEKIIKRFAKEKGRFRRDCLYAISSIAGERVVYNTEEELEKWWSQTKETYKPDRARTDAFRKETHINDMTVPALAGFYGISITSDRMSFIVDSSGSMKGDKIENLRQQTIDALSLLNKHGHVKTNVIDFGGEVTIYYPELLSPDIKGMMAYVAKGLQLSGGTRTMDALIAGLRIHDLDTICFLSDGAPIISIREPWDDIRRYINMMNRYRPVAIYCISFKADIPDFKGMAQLSWENLGSTEAIE